VPEFSRQEMVLLSRVEIIPTLRVEQNTVCVCVWGGGGGNVRIQLPTINGYYFCEVVATVSNRTLSSIWHLNTLVKMN